MKPDTLTEILERLVDKHSLVDVLVGLELVCAEKATFLQLGLVSEVHKDAKEWRVAEQACYTAASKVSV